MRHLIIVFSEILLVSLNFYIILKNPLEKEYKTPVTLLIWVFVMITVDCFLKKKKYYKEMRYIISQLLYMLIYSIQP